MVTETDELTLVLDALEEQRPDVPRSELLRDLALEAAASREQTVAERRRRLAALAGGEEGMWDPALQRRLRHEWPA